MSRKRWSCLVSIAIVFLLLLLFWPCIKKVRDGGMWIYSLNNSRQIATALNSYHDTIGHLPPAVVRDNEGRPLYSWRVVILPYLEEGNLYKQFHLDEPWDSEHNLRLAKTAPMSFMDRRGEDPSLTRYQVFTGPGTAFERPGLTFSDFSDGLNNTLLVVEAAEPVIWSKPVDLTYDPSAPLPRFGSGYKKPMIHFLCREFHWREGFAVGFADGSGRFIRNPTDEKMIRALITRNGGEKIDISWFD